MKRLLALATLLCVACTSFREGLVRNEAAVLESWDSIQIRADASGGQLLGVAWSPIGAIGRFGLVFLLAGFEGAAGVPGNVEDGIGRAARAVGLVSDAPPSPPQP